MAHNKTMTPRRQNHPRNTHEFTRGYFAFVCPGKFTRDFLSVYYSLKYMESYQTQRSYVELLLANVVRKRSLCPYVYL